MGKLDQATRVVTREPTLIMDYSEIFAKPDPKMPEDVASERASMFSMITDKEFPAVRDEMLTLGTESDTHKQVDAMAAEKQQQQQLVAKESIAADSEISPEDKLSALEVNSTKPVDYMQELADRLKLDTTGMTAREINKSLSRTLLEHDTTVTKAIAALRTRDVLEKSNLQREVALSIRLEAMGETHQGNIEGGTQIPGYAGGTTFGMVGTATSDFFGEMIPGNTSRIWLGLYDHMIGDYPVVSEDYDKWVMAGRPQADLKEYLKSLPLDQLEDELRKAKDYVIANSGMVMETNDATADHVLNGLMEDMIYQEDRELDETINSFISALDTTVVLGFAARVAKGIYKIGEGLGSALLSPVLGLNSTKKMKEIGDAIRTKALSPEDIGTTQPLLDMAELGLRDEGMPNEFIDALQGAKRTAADVADTMAHNSMTPGSYQTAEKSMEAFVSNAYPSVQKGNTILSKRVGNDIETSFLVGEGKGGFDTIGEATTLARKHSDDYEIVLKTEMNELIPIPKDVGNLKFPEGEVGEFFVRFNSKMSIPDANKLSKEITTEPGDIRGTMIPQIVHKFFSDSSNSLSQRLSRSIDSALDQTAGAASQLREIASGYTALGSRDQFTVLHTINEFIKQGKPITYFNISEMPLSAAQKMGVWSYKLATEANYKVFNSVLRRDMVSNNFKQMRTTWVDEAGKHQEFNAYGKMVDRNMVSGLKEGIKHDGIEFPAGSVVYYEHSTGAVKYLTKEAVDEVYKDGGYLLRTKDFHGEGDMVSSYIIAGKESRMLELPENVLNYSNKYNSTRIYSNNVYVRELKTIIKDGVEEKYWIARAGVNDFGAAHKKLKEIAEQTGNDPSKYKVTLSTELSEVEAKTAAEEVQTFIGKIGFNKRSEKELDGLDGMADVLDPMTSLVKSIESITSRGVTGMLLST